MPSPPVLEDTGASLAEFDGSISSKPFSVPVVENPPVHSMSNIQSDDKIIEGPLVSGVEQPGPEGIVLGGVEDIVPVLEVQTSSKHAPSPPYTVDGDSAEMKADAEAKYETDASSFPESDQNFQASVNSSSFDETGCDLPVLPLYVELTEEQKRTVRKSAVQQIAESYLHLHWSDCSQTRNALLARLVAQVTGYIFLFVSLLGMFAALSLSLARLTIVLFLISKQYMAYILHNVWVADYRNRSGFLNEGIKFVLSITCSTYVL